MGRGWVGIIQAAKHAQGNPEIGISWERDAQLQPFQLDSSLGKGAQVLVPDGRLNHNGGDRNCKSATATATELEIGRLLPVAKALEDLSTGRNWLGRDRPYSYLQ